MNPRTLPINVCLFILLECSSGTLLAADYFYRMQITIDGKTSVFYVLSQNILEDESHLLDENNPSGWVMVWDENPSSGFGVVENHWSRQKPATIRGTFSANSGEKGKYLLSPLHALPSGITERIEVDNNTYHLLPNILHHLGQQTYGRAQEYSWFKWLSRCSFLFGTGEEASQGASSSGNADLAVTEQPHSNRQSLTEQHVRIFLSHNQENSQQTELEKFLDMMTEQPSRSDMQLVSLMSSPASLISSQSSNIVLAFRVYLSSTVSEDEVHNALGLSGFSFSLALPRESSQPSDAEDKSEKSKTGE